MSKCDSLKGYREPDLRQITSSESPGASFCSLEFTAPPGLPFLCAKDHFVSLAPGSKWFSAFLLKTQQLFYLRLLMVERLIQKSGISLSRLCGISYIYIYTYLFLKLEDTPISLTELSLVPQNYHQKVSVNQFNPSQVKHCSILDRLPNQKEKRHIPH